MPLRQTSSQPSVSKLEQVLLSVCASVQVQTCNVLRGAGAIFSSELVFVGTVTVEEVLVVALRLELVLGGIASEMGWWWLRGKLGGHCVARINTSVPGHYCPMTHHVIHQTNPRRVILAVFVPSPRAVPISRLARFKSYCRL